MRANWMVAVGLVVALAGCGTGGGAQEGGVADYKTIRAMANMYVAYLADHKNQPPPSEAAFREYLTTKEEELQQSEITVDAMFVSPRSGEPLEWVYGRKAPAGPAGMTYLGYEKTPVDGKRLVIATRGMYEEMDDARFRTVFPSK